MNPMHDSEQLPLVTDDRAAAERDARRRSSEQQIEYVIGSREYFEGEVEFIVCRRDDFRALHDFGGWLIEDSYGKPITAADLIAAYVCCEIDEALLDATLRISHGAPSLFIARREHDYLVAPLADWPRFMAAGWRQFDQFASK